MGMPSGIPIVDTLIGFPHEGFGQYDFIRQQTKDRSSQEMEFPVEYMFKEAPKDLPTADPVSVTLREMDRFGIEIGVIGVSDETSRVALRRHPDRFVPTGSIEDPKRISSEHRLATSTVLSSSSGASLNSSAISDGDFRYCSSE